MKFLIIIAIYSTIFELVFPSASYISLLKYLILVPVFYWTLYYRVKTSSILFIIAYIYIVLSLYLIYGYSISIHFLVLMSLIIACINFLYRTTHASQVYILNYSYKLILGLSLLKLFVAVNIIFNLNMGPLSHMFWSVSGGGIYNVGGLSIPRITFGPEMLFLIGYLIFHKKKYSLFIVLALVFGFSRVYLLLLLLVFLYLKKFKLLIILILCGFSAMIGSTIFLDRADFIIDPRFIQWEIFSSMFPRVILIGNFNFFIENVQSLLSDSGYDYGKSECETCQLVGDLGVIPYFIALSLPLWVSRGLGLLRADLRDYFLMILLCIVAAFFNPVMVTLEFVIINFIFISAKIIKHKY